MVATARAVGRCREALGKPGNDRGSEGTALITKRGRNGLKGVWGREAGRQGGGVGTHSPS